ncbi:DoxX family membrane protein [Actinoplanes sp. DH11]|uniref:DoxX family membrane protein n=1 Tax=Actinoplanes sp. DH11 TaxID=2857011 RepID=UPI001E4BBAC9|nr:DoxX family membrane protein [Actinoplanes sp. DH11]
MRSLMNRAVLIEDTAVRFAQRHGLLLLRLSLGVVFVWFAIPKLKPGLSPVDTLAQDTIGALTFGVLTGQPATSLLAVLEFSIGVGLLLGLLLRTTLVALLLQMAGTLTPLILFPQLTWKAPGVLTLEGQFIVKNLVLIAAGVAIAGTLARRRPARNRPYPVGLKRSPDEQHRHAGAPNSLV